MSAHPTFYSPYDAPFWESVAQDAIALQQCVECDTFRYPPGACCPNCLSTDSRWQPLQGNGQVLSWTTFHKQYLPAYPAPTTVLAVKLEEGPILLASIDAAETADLAADRPVRITYRDHPDGYRIPWFTTTDLPSQP